MRVPYSTALTQGWPLTGVCIVFRPSVCMRVQYLASGQLPCHLTLLCTYGGWDAPPRSGLLALTLDLCLACALWTLPCLLFPALTVCWYVGEVSTVCALRYTHDLPRQEIISQCTAVSWDSPCLPKRRAKAFLYKAFGVVAVGCHALLRRPLATF